MDLTEDISTERINIGFALFLSLPTHMYLSGLTRRVPSGTGGQMQRSKLLMLHFSHTSLDATCNRSWTRINIIALHQAVISRPP